MLRIFSWNADDSNILDSDPTKKTLSKIKFGLNDSLWERWHSTSLARLRAHATHRATVLAFDFP
jgi:hypothetical protein